MSHLKMDGWNTTFLLGRPIFRGYVSFREGTFLNTKSQKPPSKKKWQGERILSLFGGGLCAGGKMAVSFLGGTLEL